MTYGPRHTDHPGACAGMALCSVSFETWAKSACGTNRPSHPPLGKVNRDASKTWWWTCYWPGCCRKDSRWNWAATHAAMRAHLDGHASFGFRRRYP